MAIATFKEYIEVLGKEHLVEALVKSLSRINTHLHNRSFGLISGNLKDNSDEQNRAHRVELRDAIKAAGFGYTHVRGFSLERGEPTESEPSFLVAGHQDVPDRNRLKNFLIRHGQKHDQSSVIYKPHGETRAKEIYTREEEGHKIGDVEDRGEWHPNHTTARYLTKLKGNRHFAFGQENEEITQVVYQRAASFYSPKLNIF